MNPLLLAELIRQLGTVGIPLILKLMGDIQAGRAATTVTAEDMAELQRLAAQTGEDVYKRLGITPPPPTPA